MEVQHILIITSGEHLVREHHMEWIRQAAPGAKVTVRARKQVTADELASADVVFGPPKPEWLVQAPSIRWVQLPWAGAENWIETRPGDLLLTKASGTFGIPIAEWVIGTMIMFTRNLHMYRDQQREAVWKRREDAREVHGSTVGIVGLGDIGQEVAKRASALGCRVLGARKGAGPVPAFVDAVLPLDDLLPLADFLVLAIPGTPETRNLLDLARLSQMKKGAYLLNVGRGTIVDEQALIQSLRDQHLAGAALDVTTVEPLPPDSPLWHMEQVLITPHCSGQSTEANANRRVRIFCENLRRYRTGQPLVNLVDRRSGY